MKTIRHELKASIDRAVKAEAKTRNEVTGKIAASIAGRMLKKIQKNRQKALDYYLVFIGPYGIGLGSVAELQTVLASAMTQAPNRKKKS